MMISMMTRVKAKNIMKAKLIRRGARMINMCELVSCYVGRVDLSGMM